MMHFCILCVYCNIHTVVHLTPSKKSISVLDTGLIMFRGEIFAYPLYLKQDLGKKCKIEFVCVNTTHTGVDTKVSKALAHRASTGQVQLARM